MGIFPKTPKPPCNFYIITMEVRFPTDPLSKADYEITVFHYQSWDVWRRPVIAASARPVCCGMVSEGAGAGKAVICIRMDKVKAVRL